MSTTCPMCGKAAYRVDKRSSIGEIVKIYRHSPHQSPGDDEILACTTVTKSDPDPEDLTRECDGPGCDEEISYASQCCSDDCKQAVDQAIETQ